MPYFVYCGHDDPARRDIRNRVRELHRQFIRFPQADCRCVAGGPLRDDAGGMMIGTLLVFDAKDRDCVTRFMACDPYNQEKLFSRVEIWAWDWGLGPPQGHDVSR